jgi:LL-diaminopimelate aminotransferase
MNKINYIPHPAQRLNTLGEFYFSVKLEEIRKMNARGENVLNLGIGSPDLPPHPEVIKALTETAVLPTSHGYQGYKGIPELRAAIGRFYNRNYKVQLDADTEILPLMGSKEGIIHLSMAYLNPGDEVLIPDPGYATYTAAAKLCGATTRTYALNEYNDFQPDFDALDDTDISKVKIMWVNYPHMPTGTSANKKTFEKLVEFATKNNIVLAHDNPYSFILNDNPQSLMAVEGAKDIAIELNSLSKSHNMAGWRVGMAVGNTDILSKMLLVKSNMDSGMFLGLQKAAVVALDLPNSWFTDLNKEYTARRKKVEAIFNLLKCEITPNQTGMFVWAKAPNGDLSAEALGDKILQEAKVFITPGKIFGATGERYLRISLCSTEENLDAALERIKTSLA